MYAFFKQVQRQIAINRQNKIHQKTISLLQGGSSILKKSLPGQKLKYVAQFPNKYQHLMKIEN